MAAFPVDSALDPEWNRVVAWMNVEEWTPFMAAHIFLNLDPDSSEHPAGDQGWDCDWLYRRPAFPKTQMLLNRDRPWSADARLPRDRELTLEYSRMIRLASAADPVRVRTPIQWLQWASDHDLLPAWMAGVAARYLTEPSTGYVSRPVTGAKNPISHKGGLAKASNSNMAPIKRELIEQIDRWIDEGARGTQRALAERLFAELQHRDGNALTLPKYETILGWIGQRMAAHRSADRRAGT